MPNRVYILYMVFFLAACGQEEIEFKPGPVMSDIIKNREKEKEENLKHREQTQILEKRTEKVEAHLNEDIMPVVRREQTSLRRQERLEEILHQAGNLPEDVREQLQTGLQPPLEILPYEILDSEGNRRPSLLIRGQLINLNTLKRAFEINSTNLREGSVTKSLSKSFQFEASPLRPEMAQVPLIFSGLLFELNEGEVLESLGRSIWIISEKVVLKGKISTRPKAAEAEQAGSPAGDLRITAMLIDASPSAEIDMSGGDAGVFLDRMPRATRQQIRSLHIAAIEKAFNFKKVEDQQLDVASNSELIEKVLRSYWKDIREEALKYLDEGDFSPPWQEQPRYKYGYRVQWEMQLRRTGRVAESIDRFPIIEIPEIEFSADLPGGRPGSLKLELIKPASTEIQILSKPGLPQALANKRRPAFYIREDNKLATHEEKVLYKVELSLKVPQFRLRHHRGVDSEWATEELFLGYQNMFKKSFSKEITHSWSTWFEVQAFNRGKPPASYDLAIQDSSHEAVHSLHELSFTKDLILSDLFKEALSLSGPVKEETLLTRGGSFEASTSTW